RAPSHSQRAPDRAQCARERELAGELVVRKLAGGELARGGQDPERDRKIEAAALLGQLRGREIDRDAPARKLEAGIEQGCPHAILALLYLRVRKADDGKAGQSVREVD